MAENNKKIEEAQKKLVCYFVTWNMALGTQN